MPKLDKVETELKPMSSGEVMHSPVESMTTEELFHGYAIVQTMEKFLKDRREALNARLKEVIKKTGVTTEEGHVRLAHEGTYGTMQKRVSKSPDLDALKKLLAKASIDTSEVFDEVKTLEFNPSKLNSLVELGKLKQVDVKLLFGETFALVVEPSPAIAQQLEEVAKSFAAERAALASETAFPKK